MTWSYSCVYFQQIFLIPAQIRNYYSQFFTWNLFKSTTGNLLQSQSLLPIRPVKKQNQRFYHLYHLKFKYKINLIKILIHRAYYISSSFLILHTEVTKIIKILETNSFKLSIILKQIKLFLNHKYVDNKLQITKFSSKQNIFIKLPFYGNELYIIRKNLQEVVKNYYPQIKLNIIFTDNLKISSFFKFKDRIPDTLRSSVIYKYTCNWWTRFM